MLDDLDLQAAFVLPIRNPLEVAVDLEQHDRVPLGKGLLVWLRHVLDAEHQTREYPRAFVSHGDVLGDWRSATQEIAEAIGVSWPVAAHEADARLSGFLSSYQRHHASAHERLNGRPDAVHWVEETYELLLDACRSGGSPDLSALDVLRASLADADLAYRPVLAESRLRISELTGRLDFAGKELAARNRDLSNLEARFSPLERKLKDADRKIASLRKQLASIRGSMSWRLTKPLRAANARVKRRASRRQ